MTDRPRTDARVVRVRALVLDDAAIEAGARDLSDLMRDGRDGDAVSRLRLGINLSQPACRVVEWDRERVVPIIEQLADYWDAGDPHELAEAVFDALNGNDETKEDG